MVIVRHTLVRKHTLGYVRRPYFPRAYGSIGSIVEVVGLPWATSDAADKAAPAIHLVRINPR